MGHLSRKQNLSLYFTLFPTSQPSENDGSMFISQAVRKATGKCHETMTRQSWDVPEYVGQEALVCLVDSSAGWGHINFHDLAPFAHLADFSSILFPTKAPVHKL